MLLPKARGNRFKACMIYPKMLAIFEAQGRPDKVSCVLSEKASLPFLFSISQLDNVSWSYAPVHDRLPAQVWVRAHAFVRSTTAAHEVFGTWVRGLTFSVETCKEGFTTVSQNLKLEATAKKRLKIRSVFSLQYGLMDESFARGGLTLIP